MSSLDEVGAVADAVLFEGYLLYPYRASAQKNRLRWQFGVLTPSSDGTEPTRSRTEALLEPKPGCVLRIRLRFLQLQARTPLVDDPQYFPFEEGVPRQVDAEVALADLPQTIPVELPASVVEDGLFRRECWAVRGRVVVSTDDLPGPYLVHRLRLDVINDGVCPPGAPREEVLRTSLIAAHTVRGRGGRGVGLDDRPAAVGPAVRRRVAPPSTPGRCSPGPADRSDLLLSSPIILHDHPQLAPESTINLFDGLENDEILTLRTLTLTDDEKAEARATDPRAAEIIDAVDAMPPEILERLHGAIRSLRPVGADSPAEQPPERPPWWEQEDAVDPDTDSVLVGTTPVMKGSHVVLRPGRGGDVQDRFLDGASATVHAVVHDVDGGVHVAVSVDGDPAAELQIAHGRFRYFRPDELEVPREGAGRGHRQHVPLRRRLRRRGGHAPPGPASSPRTWSWSTPASAGCTSPTSSSTATTCSSSSTRWPAAATRARSTCWSTTWTRRRRPRSTRTAWTRRPCSRSSTGWPPRWASRVRWAGCSWSAASPPHSTRAWGCRPPSRRRSGPPPTP